MPSRWTQRLQATWQSRLQRQPAPTPAQAARSLLRTVSQRTEVFPPERLYRASRWRRGLRDWLNTGWDVSRPALPVESPSAAPTPAATPVTELRAAFLETLCDVDGADDVRDLITRARSPRELWHLRTAVYTLIATQHTETQAQQRMDALNRHFPLRTFCDGLWSR